MKKYEMGTDISMDDHSLCRIWRILTLIRRSIEDSFIKDKLAKDFFENVVSVGCEMSVSEC